MTLGELYPEPDPQDGYPKNSDNKFDLEWTIRSLTLKMDISRIQIYMQY